MYSDATTTIQTLKQLLGEFRDERDWKKFHDPKSLAEAISIEAAELLELFLWKTPDEVSEAMKIDSAFRKSVEHELADVVCFTLSLANVADIEVCDAVREKIAANKLKYPVEKSKGKSTKYTQL